MAKNDSSSKKAAPEPAKTTPGRTAPAAPDATKANRTQVDSLMNDGGKVDPREAIRERLKLHPLAMTQEIVAMLEFEGMQVTPDQVEALRGQAE